VYPASSSGENIEMVAASPISNYVAAVFSNSRSPSGDFRLRIFDGITSRLISTTDLQGPRGSQIEVSTLFFSPKGPYLFLTTLILEQFASEAYVFKMTSDGPVLLSQTPMPAVMDETEVSMSADGTLLTFACVWSKSSNGLIRLQWDAASSTLQTVGVLALPDTSALYVQLSSDASGKSICVTGLMFVTLYEWNAEFKNFSSVHVFQDPALIYSYCKLSADGKYVTIAHVPVQGTVMVTVYDTSNFDTVGGTEVAGSASEQLGFAMQYVPDRPDLLVVSSGAFDNVKCKPLGRAVTVLQIANHKMQVLAQYSGPSYAFGLGVASMSQGFRTVHVLASANASSCSRMQLGFLVALRLSL
jgi:WD40 repeat protein